MMGLEKAYRPLRALVTAIRFFEWAPVVQLIAFADLLYLYLSGGGSSEFRLLGLFVFHLTLGFASVNLINNVADKRDDEAVGKFRLQFFSHSFYVATVLALIAAATALIFLLYDDPRVEWGLGTLFLAGLLYSLRPIRFKERGVWGIIVAALAGRVPAVVIPILTYGMNDMAWYLLGWLLILAVIHESAHQLDDRENDIATKTRTVFAQVSAGEAKAFIRISSALFLLYLLLASVLFFPEGMLLVILLVLFSSATLSTISQVLHRRG